MPKSLASFCRLCLTKTASKVPVFGGDQENVTNLLALIELSINPETESDAVLCFDCVVTLETFLQYKDQCHVNDAFLKTLPPKDSAEDSEASEEEEDAVAMECDILQVEDDGAESGDSELVEVVEPQKKAKSKVSPKPKKEIRKAKQLKVVKVAEDPLNIKRSSRVQRQKAKPEPSPKKKTHRAE
uniref:(northern house mosquito) hypothetical protein n=1 Tax=Culex pipiens TaxID=7175 RepID=A0A8D8B4Y3_CULPI